MQLSKVQCLPDVETLTCKSCFKAAHKIHSRPRLCFSVGTNLLQRCHVYLCHPHSWLYYPTFHGYHNRLNSTISIKYNIGTHYICWLAVDTDRLVIDTVHDKGNVLRGLLRGTTVNKHKKHRNYAHFVSRSQHPNSTKIDLLWPAFAKSAAKSRIQILSIHQCSGVKISPQTCHSIALHCEISWRWKTWVVFTQVCVCVARTGCPISTDLSPNHQISMKVMNAMPRTKFYSQLHHLSHFACSLVPVVRSLMACRNLAVPHNTYHGLQTCKFWIRVTDFEMWWMSDTSALLGTFLPFPRCFFIFLHDRRTTGCGVFFSAFATEKHTYA